MYRPNDDTVDTTKRPPNPWTNANIFEIMTFSWILTLFKKGRKKDLEINDLYVIPNDFSTSSLGSELEEKWNIEMTNMKKTNQEPSLLRVFAQMYGFKIILFGLNILFVSTVIRMSQPVLIGKLLAYFNQDKSNVVDMNDAYLYAFGLVLSMLISTLLLHYSMVQLQQYGLKMRIACCSLIFKKALRLSRTSFDEIKVGQIVNLISKDVTRFEYACKSLNTLYIGPVITVIVMYFMWQEIGISSLFGVIALSMFIPIQLWLGKKNSKFQSSIAPKTDNRIRLMNEIISGIKVIKMYTWEKTFSNLMYHCRKTELEQISKGAYIKLVLRSFQIYQTRLALFVSILSYILLGNYMNTQKIFVIIAYYNLLVTPMTKLFPTSIEIAVDLLVSIKRIQNFLLCAEKEESISSCTKTEDILGSGDKTSAIELENIATQDADISIKMEQSNEIGIDISNTSAKWIHNQSNCSLNNINLIVRPGRMAAVVGSVGAGKSSLIHLILRELPISKGNISVRGVVSYASQEPWLFNGSVRQNIIFDSEMNNERYKEVMKICALIPDLKQFPHGDETIVGENGVSLSGGQKARINLARAVYKQADIYLLDDPLSAVDSNVGKHLFENCIKDYLKEKICILVTHQTQYLESVDQIILLKHGNVVAEGNFQELQSSGFNFGTLLGSSDVSNQTSNNKSCDVDKEVRMSVEPLSTLSRKNSVQSVSSSIDGGKSIGEHSEQVEVAETRAYGKVSQKVYFSYISAAGNRFKISFLLLTCILTQIVCTGGDYWISYWVDLEGHVFHNVEGGSMDNSTVPNDRPTNFLWRWSISSDTCVIVFVVISVCLLIITFIRVATCVSVFKDISMNLHDNMFNAIVRATMYFFTTNSSGRILNRFTSDIAAIDERLPLPLVDLIDSTSVTLGLIAVLGLTRINLLWPIIIVGVFFYYASVYYFSLSRSVRRLELISRSNVLAHLNASIRGLTTIRAFKAEHVLSKEFEKHLDLHSSAWFLCINSSQAFGFALDTIVNFTITTLVFSLIILYNDTYGGTVGLIITQAMSVASVLQWGIRQSAEVENQIASVERVLEYTNVPQESPFESSQDKKPSKNWPDKGSIEFQNYNLRYSPDELYALKNINIKIQPMEKIGIVGRTGAGKSSLIEALFRLAHNEGNIFIDDMEIHKLGLQELRSKISVIPQEPVLFSGTIRKNLDPYDECPDHVLWNVLDEVELRRFVENLPGGLNSKISDGGANFSVGQKQLICLARAVLRDNRILVLDEATANVDLQTDALIQDTIRKKFRECTVLTIAHRLNTVMDSDKVLVMDSGTVVEFDQPHVLLKNSEGFLYKMVKQTGHATADFLHGVAFQSFKAMTSELLLHAENIAEKNK